MEDVVGILAVVCIFIGLPWLIFHYVTKWKTAATLTSGDEALLDELYHLARRLQDRMDTVERLVAADNPGFAPTRLPPADAADEAPPHDLAALRARKERIVR